MHMMWTLEIHVFELRIEANFQCTILAVMRVPKYSNKKGLKSTLPTRCASLAYVASFSVRCVSVVWKMGREQQVRPKQIFARKYQGNAFSIAKTKYRHEFIRCCFGETLKNIRMLLAGFESVSFRVLVSLDAAFTVTRLSDTRVNTVLFLCSFSI